MSKKFYKIDRGIVFTSQAGPPSDPVNGAIYYDGPLNKFRKYEANAWSDLDTNTGSGGGSSSRSGTDTNQLYDELRLDELDLLNSPIINQLIDDFDDTEKGTKTNLIQDLSALKFSGSSLNGSYERLKTVSVRLSGSKGIMIMALQALAPKNTAISSNTIIFNGDVTGYFSVGKNVIIATKTTSDGSDVHLFLVNVDNNVAQLEIDSVSYDSVADETTLVLLNPNSLDLDMDLSSSSYFTNLRVMPFNHKCEVKSKTSGSYEQVKITDAQGLETISLLGSLGVSGFQVSGSVAGTIFKSNIFFSPNGTYGLLLVATKISSDVGFRWLYTKNRGSNWTDFGVQELMGLGGDDELNLFLPQYFNNPASSIVADNGKCFSIWSPLTGAGGYKVKGKYSDLSVGSPTLSASVATGVDAANSEGASAAFIFQNTSPGNSWFGQVHGDLTDLSFVAVSGKSTGNEMYIRWYTAGGATHSALSSSISGTTYQQPYDLQVTGSSTTHKTHLMINTGSANSYHVYNQGTTSPASTDGATLSTNNFRTLGLKAGSTRKYHFERNLTTDALEFHQDLISATTFGSIKTLISSIGGSGLTPSNYQGNYTSTSTNHENYYKQIRNRIVIDPNNELHALMITEIQHPDGCERATLFEILDASNFVGPQITQYTNNNTNAIRSHTSDSWHGQTFTATAGLTRIRTAMFRVYQQGAIPAGYTITAELQATTGGLPNGTVLATAINQYDPSKITTSANGQWLMWNFPSTALTNGTVYAVVMKPTFPIDGVNLLQAICSNSNSYGSGERVRYDSISTLWVGHATLDYCFAIDGDYVYDCGNATPASANFESRDRHNFECTVALGDTGTAQVAWRKIKNPGAATAANAFPTTGHIYTRLLTFNAGAMSTIGAIEQKGYDVFDDNLVFNVGLGTDDCARLDTVTGAVTAAAKAEDRSGWVLPSTYQGGISSSNFVSDVDFQEGKALNFAGSSTTEFINGGILLSGEPVSLSGVNRKFAIECEVKIATLSTQPIFVGYKHSSDTTSGWTFGTDGTGKLRWAHGTTVTLASNLTLSLATKYKVKVTGDGTTIRLYVDGVECAYSSQTTAGYTIAVSSNGPALGVGLGSYGNSRAIDTQWIGKLGYVRIARDASTFVNANYAPQAPLISLFNFGNGIKAEHRVGQNSILAPSSQTNFDQIGTSSNKTATSVVDSNDLLFMWDHTIAGVHGSNMSLKLTLDRASSFDPSYVKGMNTVFPKSTI